MAKTPSREAEKETKPPPVQENEEEITPFERMRRFTKAVISVPKEEATKPKPKQR